VSSDNNKFNDVSISKTCNFDNFLTTNIISTIDESNVCLTHNECVCIEDYSNSIDVQLFYTNRPSMARNLNLITANANVPVENNVYSGIVSLNNEISCDGDVFTTACYLDKCNVFYDDCMFTTPLPGIAACTYIYIYMIAPFRLAWRWFPTN
jgi:hypothetical protein